jgi:ABC-type glutathione transport system ATPase component
MQKELILEVKNLKTYFQTEGNLVKAVDDISFDIYKGETIGIVGESGSGKSVTSLSIMRLIQSPPGEIVGGEVIYHQNANTAIDLLSLKDKEMRKYRGNDIAMIFQEPMTSLNPVFTCGDQVLEAIQLHRKLDKTTGKNLTLSLFEKVELPEPERIYDSYPHQLSGGQKQRVMIAMAMSCNPSLLIADEPTTALDVTVQKAILKLMADLKQEINASVIFITHDLGVIAEIADRVLVMYQGKIVEQGTVEAIFSNPKHPYTKGLLACRPPLDFRMKKLPVIDDFMEIIINDNGVNQLKEKEFSVEKVINDLKIDSSSTQNRFRELSTKQPILKVENLKTWFPIEKSFFGKPKRFLKAVNDVSFEVYPGETLGLVGESGCGKTTLGRTILRLTKPIAGKVLFEEQDLLLLSQKEMIPFRKDMQIIFQDPYSSLNPRMTIGQAIIEPMIVHNLYDNPNMRKEKVIDLLNTVGLSSDHYNRYPHEFSGGQRQRVGIARALSLNPRFIICDESVSALDVSVQAQVLNLLMDLREKYGFTYIFISHDLSVVKFMSDRMIVMKQGKIEEIGLADDIYNNPQKQYTQQLIDAIPKGR